MLSKFSYTKQKHKTNKQAVGNMYNFMIDDSLKYELSKEFCGG